ncbi:histidine kinase [Novosphingobium sp. TH158]|nr:histidine kinase [Novosphingobium sp. TH158]
MEQGAPALALQVETVAELRELYRAAEARAARMRLMSTSGRQLALAEPGTAGPILDGCAERLAYFLGSRKGTVSHDPAAPGLPIPAPGSGNRKIGAVQIEGFSALDDIADPEDREACRLHLEMMGATIDRIDREQRLEFVVGRLFTAQEEERRRVSHELHDGVAQTATALARMLEGASTGGRDLEAADRGRLAAIARELVGELRAVIRGLRPTILDDLGLAAGLHSLGEGIEAEGYRVTVRIDSDVAAWPSHVETALFRVAQEAVTNIRKHAGGPCAVTIELSARKDGPLPFLRVADGGRGAAAGGSGVPSGPRERFGIDVMRERMASIGGALDWQAGPAGVTVTASFPRPE